MAKVHRGKRFLLMELLGPPHGHKLVSLLAKHSRMDVSVLMLWISCDILSIYFPRCKMARAVRIQDRLGSYTNHIKASDHLTLTTWRNLLSPYVVKLIHVFMVIETLILKYCKYVFNHYYIFCWTTARLERIWAYLRLPSEGFAYH